MEGVRGWGIEEIDKISDRGFGVGTNGGGGDGRDGWVDSDIGCVCAGREGCCCYSAWDRNRSYTQAGGSNLADNRL